MTPRVFAQTEGRANSGRQAGVLSRRRKARRAGRIGVADSPRPQLFIIIERSALIHIFYNI